MPQTSDYQPATHHYARVTGVLKGKRKPITATASLGYNVDDDAAIATAHEVLRDYKPGATAVVIRVVGKMRIDDGHRVFKAALYGATTVVVDVHNPLTGGPSVAVVRHDRPSV